MQGNKMKRKCEICHKEYDDEKDGVEFGVSGSPIYFCSINCFSKAANKSKKTAEKVRNLMRQKINKEN
jgi:hypothetical protein